MNDKLAEIKQEAEDAAIDFDGRFAWGSNAQSKLLAAMRGEDVSAWASEGEGNWAKAHDFSLRVERATTMSELCELVSEEAEDVLSDAASAAEFGQSAIRFLEDQLFDQALEEAQEAARCERQYGDAPSWGPFLSLVESLVEDFKEEAEEAEGGWL